MDLRKVPDTTEMKFQSCLEALLVHNQQLLLSAVFCIQGRSGRRPHPHWYQVRPVLLHPKMPFYGNHFVKHTQGHHRAGRLGTEENHGQYLCLLQCQSASKVAFPVEKSDGDRAGYYNVCLHAMHSLALKNCHTCSSSWVYCCIPWHPIFAN